MRPPLITAILALEVCWSRALSADGRSSDGFSTAFLVVAAIAIAFLSLSILNMFFEPGLRYRVRAPGSDSNESDDFLRLLEALTDARVRPNTRVEVLTNGENYFEAELQAIRGACRNVNIEAYIFQRGRVAQQFIEALAERARAGVQVKMVIDALGSLTSTNSYLSRLIEAGGRIAWYHPLRWHNFQRFNNRTHRELIIVDGTVGFIGGSGIADCWLYGVRGQPRWRDTMLRVEGDSVTALQATFAENWLEACGEILSGRDYFPPCEIPAPLRAAMVVNSAPSAGGSTRARILFQTLLASARRTLHITTPYFLPDQSARAEMIRAAKRGVEVKVIVPGKKSDHALTRRSSRRLFGDLLRNGVRVFEYQPAMIHNKCMLIDGVWSVAGSTNFDHRSFGLNDEVNLAVLDKELSARLEQDFQRDLADSHEVSYEEWRKRLVLERFQEWVGWVLERQQ